MAFTTKQIMMIGLALAVIGGLMVLTLTMEDENGSGNGNIIGNGASVPIINGYTFIQGKDSSGNDIGRQKSLIDNIPGLKKWCTARANCKGFNTSGYMKYAVRPIQNMKTWSSDPVKGFYVKN